MKDDLNGDRNKKGNMVLALFYVVAIQTRFVPGSFKSVHFQRSKIKQFLQNRKYIYFCRLYILLVEKQSVIYYKPHIGRQKKGRYTTIDT